MDDDDSQIVNKSSVDCQIQQQLECLNSTSQQINKLENELNIKRNQYRQVLSDSSLALKLLAHNLGNCVSQARPYYDARRILKEAQNATQLATLKFERAVSVHAAAREMVKVAEHGMHNNPSNAVWIEMLNRANDKVNQAEMDKLKCEAEHEHRAFDFKIANDNLSMLKKILKKSIKKSMPYFELKRYDQEKLEKMSLDVEETAYKLQNLKLDYSKALKKLEEISNTIHAKRESTADTACKLLGEKESVKNVGTVSSTSFSEAAALSAIERDAALTTVINDLKQVDSLEHLDSVTYVSSVSNINDDVFDDDDSTVYSIQSQFSNSSKESNSSKKSVVGVQSTLCPHKVATPASATIPGPTNLFENSFEKDALKDNKQRLISRDLFNDNSNTVTSKFNSKSQTASSVLSSPQKSSSKSNFKSRADEIASLLHTKSIQFKGPVLTPIASREGILGENNGCTTSNTAVKNCNNGSNYSLNSTDTSKLSDFAKNESVMSAVSSTSDDIFDD